MDEKSSNKENRMLQEPEFDREGWAPYTWQGKEYRLWYGIVGQGERPPLLVLHGGPGGNHHNLVAFQELAKDREVIFYDQLGCGKSDRPDDPSLWTADRYFDEVQAVCEALKLGKYHLAGHSWGTTLATGFAARHPEGIITLSLHSPVLSFPYYVTNVAPALKASLKSAGGQAGRIIDEYERCGRGAEEPYKEACLEFVQRCVTHSWPLPGAMQRLVAERNKQVHGAMVASSSELNVPGNLKSVDVTEQLRDIKVPILMTCGRDDMITPEFMLWQSGFANDSQTRIIENSAHMTPVDNPEALISIQQQFLEQNEQ